MARLFLIPVLLALLPEGVIAFAMVAGIVWLGHVIYGFIFAAGAILLMALPFLGELRVDFDSAGPKVAVTAGWWGRFAYQGGEPAEMRLRFLGLPYRRRLEKKPPKRKPAERPRVDMKRWALTNKADLSRLLLAALQSGNEFVWGSRALAVKGNAPAQIGIVDQLISGLIGHRMVGPLDIEALPEGGRRVRFTYRIRLAAAFFVGLFVLLQGRPFALARSFRKARRRAEATRPRVAQPATRPPQYQRPPPPDDGKESRRPRRAA